MSREAVESLIDRWINEPSFRAALRADLDGAVKSSGLSLDDAEWAALRGIDWSLSDEDLRARVNMAL